MKNALEKLFVEIVDTITAVYILIVGLVVVFAEPSELLANCTTIDIIVLAAIAATVYGLKVLAEEIKEEKGWN